MSVGQGPTDHARTITGAFAAQRKLDAIEPTRAQLLALVRELERDANLADMAGRDGQSIAYGDAAARLRGVLGMGKP